MDAELMQTMVEMIREQMAHARWDAIVMLWNSFLTAAQANWWLWLVAVAYVLVLGRKGLLRLAAYVGGGFVRSEMRG